MPALFMRVHHWSPAKVGAVASSFRSPGVARSWPDDVPFTSKRRNDAPILMTMGDALACLPLA